MTDVANTVRERITRLTLADRKYERPVSWDEAHMLLARIEKLEAALREIAASAWDCNGKTCDHCRPNNCENAFIARKALEGKDERRS